MSPALAVKTLWEKWKITVVFVALFGLAIFTHEVDVKHNADTCASVTQVRDATRPLTKPTSAAGVTDPVTLQRIHIANAAKATARAKLEHGLACR